MSIRMIARELYALQLQADGLERDLQSVSPEKREELKERLRQIRAEKDRMRRILEGRKEPPAAMKPR